MNGIEIMIIAMICGVGLIVAIAVISIHDSYVRIENNRLEDYNKFVEKNISNCKDFMADSQVEYDYFDDRDIILSKNHKLYDHIERLGQKLGCLDNHGNVVKRD